MSPPHSISKYENVYVQKLDRGTFASTCLDANNNRLGFWFVESTTLYYYYVVIYIFRV